MDKITHISERLRELFGPQAEVLGRETEIQPHSVADDFRREAETFVIGSNAVCFHEAILAYCSALLPS